MFFHELLTETYKSKAQARLFHACAGGADYDACGGTSRKKWKSMAREFSDSTPDESALPERKKNHTMNCMCAHCESRATNAFPHMKADEPINAFPHMKNRALNAFEDESQDISLCDRGLDIIDEIEMMNPDLKIKGKLKTLGNLLRMLKHREESEEDDEF